MYQLIAHLAMLCVDFEPLVRHLLRASIISSQPHSWVLPCILISYITLLLMPGSRSVSLSLPAPPSFQFLTQLIAYLRCHCLRAWWLRWLFGVVGASPSLSAPLFFCSLHFVSFSLIILRLFSFSFFFIVVLWFSLVFACSSVSLKQCWYSSEKERENAERYRDGGEVKEGGEMRWGEEFIRYHCWQTACIVCELPWPSWEYNLVVTVESQWSTRQQSKESDGLPFLNWCQATLSERELFPIKRLSAIRRNRSVWADDLWRMMCLLPTVSWVWVITKATHEWEWYSPFARAMSFRSSVTWTMHHISRRCCTGSCMSWYCWEVLL